MERDNREKQKEMHQYVSGLKRYQEKGVPIYIDGLPAGPEDWEALFELKEEEAFYMGDFVETEAGELKEIRFDKVRYK